MQALLQSARAWIRSDAARWEGADSDEEVVPYYMRLLGVPELCVLAQFALGVLALLPISTGAALHLCVTAGTLPQVMDKWLKPVQAPQAPSTPAAAADGASTTSSPPPTVARGR